MKNIIAFITIVFVISLASCKGGVDKKALCKKAMNNMINVMKNDPAMQKVGAEIAKKMEEEAKKDMDKNLEQCVSQFNKEVTECVANAKSMQDISKCEPKKQ